MRGLLLAVLALAALAASACGAGEPGAAGVSTSRSDEQPPEAVPAPDPSQVYEGSGTVLEAAEEHGPELCLGAILTSLPPQCSGVPIANWDWKAVEGERSRSGTTWGDYHVVGTYDGEVFTVTEVGPPAYQEWEDIYRYETPCPEPEGGWVVPDPAHNTQEETRRAHAYARAQADYVISWNDHLEDELQEFGPVVLVAVFTGDAERHDAEIRKVWDGPLCLVARDLPTARELARIRKEVENRLPDLGLELLGSGIGGFPPTIFVDIVADEGGRAQAVIDDEYGPGIVRFVPALRPVQGQ
jgi:hypothetical protein